MYPILSSSLIRQIHSAIKEKKSSLDVSLDLGYTSTLTSITLTDDGFVFDKQSFVLPMIRDDDKSCYLLIDGVIEKAQYFNGAGVYKLIPTALRPIMQISGTSMHKQSFIERVESDKLQGRILDAGTGLGYTAIAAAKTAEAVITVEVDPMVLALQKINPYSQELFLNKRITLIEGDIVALIRNFRNVEFNYIILDGGTPKSSGDFFSPQQYAEVFRVLKKDGSLYHYIPRYHEKRGIDFSKSIEKILKKVGFKHIVVDKEGSFLIAKK